jgi:hypothetical protein
MIITLEMTPRFLGLVIAAQQVCFPLPSFFHGDFSQKKKGSDIPHSHVHRGIPHTARLLPPLVFSSSDHLCFLCPGALARLRDTRLCCWSRACSSPLPSSSEPAPVSSLSLPPTAGDTEGVMTMPYFAPASRLLAPRCPNGRSSRRPNLW